MNTMVMWIKAISRFTYQRRIKTIIQRSGGVTLIEIDHLLDNKQLITNQMGHVLIDYYSSLSFRNINDIQIFKISTRSI